MPASPNAVPTASTLDLSFPSMLTKSLPSCSSRSCLTVMPFGDLNTRESRLMMAASV